MPNQKPSEKKDRNGGGDVTKASEVDAEVADKTTWDILNNHGPGRFDPEGE